MHRLKKPLSVIAQLVFFLLFIRYGWSILDWISAGELVAVGVATPVRGRVSKCDVNRQHFRWYLNEERVRYDFWEFTAGDPATRRMQDQIQQQNKGNIYYYNTLAYYLEVGDQVSKSANSPLLRVRRGHEVTVWTCAK